MIVNNLARKKLDPNVEPVDPVARDAFDLYHAYIEAARIAMEVDHGAGLVLDIQGHQLDHPSVQLGYGLEEGDLALSDAKLDQDGLETKSSIRQLSLNSTLEFSELLRGNESYGGLLEKHGLSSLPSPTEPSASVTTYIETDRTVTDHGSEIHGMVDAIQVAFPVSSIDGVALEETSETFANTTADFLEKHYDFEVISHAARHRTV